MMLQALDQLARRENLIPEPGYEPRPVAWLARLDGDGRLLGVIGTHYTPPAEGRRRPRPVAKSMLIPRRSGRTSGDRAEFLVDKAEYVFGIDPNGKRGEAKLKKRAELFRELVAACADDTGDASAKAVSTFLDDVAEGRQSIQLPEDCQSNDVFAFVVSPEMDPIHLRPAVKEWWAGQREAPQEPENSEAMCLVTGRPVQDAGLVPMLRKVPGGSTSGVALVSFNSSAFESYGWSSNDNAPISQEAAETTTTALNRLLDPAYPDPHDPDQKLPPRRLVLSGDTVVVYWSARETGDSFANVFGALLEANPAEVGEAYRSVWRGRPPRIRDPSAFYALTLTGTQGRVIVRDWLETSVTEAAEHLAQHFTDIAVVRNTPPPRGGEHPPGFPMPLLLEALADPAQNRREAVPAPLATAVVKAAITGQPYPLTALQRAVLRYRAELSREDQEYRVRLWNDARAALIKAVLNRRVRRGLNANLHSLEAHMDPDNTAPGYLLGRLMAVVERMQQEALPGLNATVVDRFFSGASAAPASAFPRLLKNFRHHASKAKDDPAHGRTAQWLDRQADEILSHLPAGFPSYLDLEAQGQFVLGYHHERHWLWQPRAQREGAATQAASAEGS